MKALQNTNNDDTSKECKITFIIGNGFDLGLGMKTKYTDVYGGYIKTPSKSETITRFKEDLQKDGRNNYKNWSDFEMGMAEYAKTLSSEEELVECVRDFKDYMVKHLQSENDKIAKLIADKEDYRNVANEFSRSIKKFYEGLIPNDASQIKEMMNQGCDYQYITFNYTDAFDSLLEIERKYNRRWFSNLIHVHGQLGKDVVMGIDNEEQLHGASFALTRKGRRAFVKTFFNEHFDTSRVKLARQAIIESDIICVYGFAMGETDNTWVWLLSDWLLRDVNHHLVAFKYDSPKLGAHNYDQIMDAEDELKVEMMRKLQIGEEHILDQIHIPVGRDIFNFKEILFDESADLPEFDPMDTYESKTYVMSGTP